MVYKQLNTNILNALASSYKAVNRDSYEAAINDMNSPLEDLTLMPLIFTKIKDLYEITTLNMPAIVSIIYSLYAKHRLLSKYQNVRCQNGLRKAMCNVTGWKNSTMCNYWQPIAQAYYKNPNFRERVERESAEILTYIQSIEYKQLTN
ncbi:hypothetical protein [Arcticibacter eurypsychrophilus]|uniref:hypothetical protein n=1 Tax=Arcticibacter eurypsychrophilus TaxID=1434752 RepID=UPI00084D1114|nr:hypothetical protein [Arcticibacter eurypsychrophilus]